MIEITRNKYICNNCGFVTYYIVKKCPACNKSKFIITQIDEYGQT